MRLFSNTIRLGGVALACGVAAVGLTPSAANAWWAPPGVVVVAPGPVLPPPVVYPPRVVYTPYPYRHHWVRPHYDWRGVFFPGHWV